MSPRRPRPLGAGEVPVGAQAELKMAPQLAAGQAMLHTMGGFQQYLVQMLLEQPQQQQQQVLLLQQQQQQQLLHMETGLDQVQMLQFAALVSAVQEAQSGTGALVFQPLALAPAPLQVGSSSWGGELKHAAERRRSVAAATAAVGDKAPKPTAVLPSAFAKVTVGLGKPPPRQERVEGMVYVVKGEKKRWVGSRRFVPCCKYPNCDKLQQGQSAFCKKHGGGWRCEIQGCTSAARGSLKFCFAHGGRKDNVVPTMPKNRRRLARDTQPVQQETSDSDDDPVSQQVPQQQQQQQQQQQ
jgi:hypothetical protein